MESDPDSPVAARAITESPFKRSFNQSVTDEDLLVADEAEQPPRKRRENNENRNVNVAREPSSPADSDDDLPSAAISQRLHQRRSMLEMSQISQNVQVINIEDVVVAGQVKEIELENFMCHKNLKMRFNTDKYNCFYIVGPNGSGKSAIFAGLNIGLGGKGRANNRGNTLSSYIKEGEPSAKIRVHLSNTGDNKHPQYDDEIIIERIIRQTSTSYSLKSMDARGKITQVSTAKKDLDNILKRFCIELENPLCWLSQDRAREFLQEMKPNKLYEIFMITSELCIVNRHHTTTAEQLQDMQLILDNWKEKQREMKENFEKLKQIAESTEKIEKFKSDLSKLHWILLWIPMKMNHQKVEKIEQALEKLAKDSEDAKKKIDGRDAESTELRQAIDEMAKRLDELNQQITDNKLEIRRWKTMQIDDGMKAKNIATRISQCKRRIQSQEEEIKLANTQLESVLGRADRDIIGEKADLLRKIGEKEDRHQELKEHKDALGQQRMEVESNRRQLVESIQENDNFVRNLRNEISKIERHRRERERIATDQMARFGPDTTNILKSLDDYASKFTKKPIGPVGMFIKCNDIRWNNAVEYLCRNNLGYYLCDNAQDRRIFENMLKHLKIAPVSVATVKFSGQKYNTSRDEPDRNFLTVARATTIKDATVFNYLVDVFHIESVILFERDDEAREVMSRNPPHHVFKAYTESCGEVFPSKPDRPYRYYAGKGYRARVLGDAHDGNDDDGEQRIRDYQRQIAEVEKQKEGIRREEAEIKEKQNAILKEIQNNALECNIIEKEISNFESEVRKLESIASRETLINSSKEAIAELKRTLQTHIASLEQAEEEQRACTRDFEERSKNINEFLEHGKELTDQLRVVEDEAVKARHEFDNFDQATEKLRTCIRNYERQVVRQNEVKSKLIKDREAIEKDLEKVDEYEKPDNMNDPPDFDSLIEKDECERRIIKFKMEIAKLNKLNKGQHVTPGELEAAKVAYEKAAKAERDYDKKLKNVNHSFLAREELFAKVKEEIPIKLREKFCDLMRMRNYIGDLTVDHEAGRIEISVQTHKDANKGRSQQTQSQAMDESDDEADRLVSNAQANKQRQKNLVQDLKGLSGGERSYTTACFVMALWSCVESPFRCLDEFDVFMDMVNRRIIMELLSDLARDHRHIQFFFFTPQGISELQANDVEVFTMAPARR